MTRFHSPQAAQMAASHRARTGGRLVLRGAMLNAVLAVVKIGAGVLGNTYALVADGVESLADIVSSLMVWAGFYWAAKPPDDNHPYGHGKAEALAALAVGLSLFAAAGWIAVHAAREIRTPHQVPAPWTLAVLALVVVTKAIFARRLEAAGAETGSRGLHAEAWHHGADAITSAAAFVGIVIALWGGPELAAADDWAALVACGVIVINGGRILQRAIGDVMDLAAPDEVSARIAAEARNVTGVHDVEKLRVRRSGLSYLVDLHIEVDPTISVRAGHDIAGAVKHYLLAAPLQITDVVVHVEPAGIRDRGTT